MPEISFRNKMFTRSRPLFYMPAWKVERGELAQCEGVFMKNFDMYARPGEQIAALVFAATDLLASIEINADISDIYFVHNYVYYISPVGRMKKDIIERVFESSKRLVAEVNTNLSRV